MRTQAITLGAALALPLSAGVLAQGDRSPLDAAADPRLDRPNTSVVMRSPGEDAAAIRDRLVGSFISAAKPGTPALVLHSAPIQVDGVPDVVLVQVARADSPGEPFRVYALQPFARSDHVTLRVHEFVPPGLRDALAGLWAAPNAVAPLPKSALTPSMDIDMDEKADGAWTGRTKHPFPTTRDAAVDVSGAIRVGTRYLDLRDTGTDAEGKRVWGQSPDEWIHFERTGIQPSVRNEDGGLVIITTVQPKPDAIKLQPGGEIAIQYSSWTSTGQFIEPSRAAGKDPARTRVPGRLISGLNTGLAGIAKGERRRIVIPPALAYGEVGKGSVPPNSTMIFDIECVYVDNTQGPVEQPPPRPVPGMANPHGPRSSMGPGSPPPSTPQGPIGSPPTNGTPEAPR